MISSGFRPPQFSEYRDWLPPWLQQGSLLDDDNNSKDTRNPFMGSCKVQGNNVFERDVLLSAREENGYSKFCLQLSGSDNSPFHMTPSGNLPQFHLHLSPNGTPQYTPSSASSALQKERSGLNDIPSRELLSQTALPPNRNLPSGQEAEHGLPSAKMDMKSRMNPRSRFPSISKDGKSSLKKLKEKTNCRDLVAADITNAVELSIAASEALAISDLVNDGSASEVLETSSVLEVALHVKQARNQLCTFRLENISDCVNDVIDESDLLQELDDDIMADAYADVGLNAKPSASAEGDLCSSKAGPEHGCSLSGSVSRVLDTPDPEDHYGGDVRLENSKLRSQEVEFHGVSNQRENEDALTMDLTSKDSHSLSLVGVRQENLSGDRNFVVDTFSAETHSEPHINLSVHSKEEGTIDQIIKTAIDCGSLLHTQENLLSSAQIRKKGDDGAKAFYTTQSTYASRWLGGWTGEEVNVVGDIPQNTVKRVTNFVIRETSYISESADILPDENSSLKRPENGQIISSLSSVAYEGLCSTTKVMEFSQDLMLPCNLSMVDPLCSVVPCSISSADANVNMNTNQSNIDIEADNCLNAILEYELGNPRTTPPRADSGNEKGHELNIADDSLASTRRQLTSLGTYSMLMPPWKDDLDRSANQGRSDPVTGVSEFLNFEENIDCFKSSSRKEINRYCKPASENTSVKDCGKDNGNLPVGRLISTSANDTAHNDERRSSPLIFNRRARRRVRASKILPSDECGGINLQTASVPKEIETRGEICDSDRSAVAPNQSLQSSNPNPCIDQGPARKKVRFSEADAIIVEKRSAPNPQSVYRTRSSTGTGKRLKKFNLQPESRPHNENTCVKNGVIRDKRRMIFRGLEFLLTGFTCKKERELEMLIRKHGGFLVCDVPHPPLKGTKRRFRCKLQQLPVLLSPKKLQTHKFLYGCAVNAFLLHANWLTDSIGVGQLLPPEKYMILPNPNSTKHSRIGQPVYCADVSYIFHKLGILLHGNHSFCTIMGTILKHGGGQVYKTIQWLVQSLKKGTISVGAIVVEDESSASRHLRHCASEQNLPVMPASWITETLLLRKLIPLKDSRLFPSFTSKELFTSMQMSEQI